MLLGIAYRMLGSVADAEDIVQDAWLRWNEVTGPVGDPRAYLARTVTNLSINRLGSAAVRRESYVGSWLPEPLLTSPDIAEDVAAAESLADSLSMAVLVLLESLSPLERAVFVLREAFGFSYPDIAEALERSEAAVRQVGHRARAHVHARRPRFEASEEVGKRVTARFVAASMGGDINAVMELLAPDVTMWSDGGGKVRAALRPISGADKIARFLVSVRDVVGRLDVRYEHVNGSPAVVMSREGVPDSVTVLDIADGRITAIWLIRNPDKIRGLPQVDLV
ncbi:RNA polymerase subunit sigma-24 [Spongiactinospora rosea]|uniref:RNA polymerase subunit sigma-24 n=2 Tax=Spongiactinospora rosea TaxID=2248750 RepID=A0A366LYS4_9ACTN|nr:RNA polymerase subunit sigma-24 [Spongiactinospora rosea]